MEFLRFGSSIPGGYWGCCAADIIQNFKQDPDEKASIQIANGDAGIPQMDAQGRSQFAGVTYRDIFWQRLRYDTFSTTDMPNHAFFLILTESQINGTYGKAWLAIIKEAGFEFVRTVCNSVYSGQSLSNTPSDKSQNHIFALRRNIGMGNIKDPFTPPKQWTDLPSVTPEAWEQIPPEARILLTKAQRQAQRAVWDKMPPKKFYTEAELEGLGIPITYSGLRSEFPQESKSVRENRQGKKAAKVDPFATKNAA